MSIELIAKHVEDTIESMNAANSAWRDMVRIGNELGIDEKDITPDAIVNAIAKMKTNMVRMENTIEVLNNTVDSFLY